MGSRGRTARSSSVLAHVDQIPRRDGAWTDVGELGRGVDSLRSACGQISKKRRKGRISFVQNEVVDLSKLVLFDGDIGPPATTVTPELLHWPMI
jgi:hypothetical protein